MSETITDNAMKPSEAVATYKRITRLGVKYGKLGDEIWAEWKKLGAFIIERQQIAKSKSGATRGTTYAAALAKAMGAFHEGYYQKLSDDGIASALVRCLEEPAVEAWRNRLPPEDRPSSPRRVWDAYQYSLRSSPEFKDADLVRPRAAKEDGEGKEKKSRASNRQDMLDEFRDIADQIVTNLMDGLDAREAVVDPQKFAERMYAKLVLQGFDPSDSDRMGDALIAYGRYLIALGEDLKRGRSLPRSLDLKADDYEEVA